jgi:hypothetical protein
MHVVDGQVGVMTALYPIRDDEGVDWPYMIACNGRAEFTQDPYVFYGWPEVKDARV